MRFSNGFFGENEATLGTLRFSAMRREVFEENADYTQYTRKYTANPY